MTVHVWYILYWPRWKKSDLIISVKLIANRLAWELVPYRCSMAGDPSASGTAGGIHGNPASNCHLTLSHWKEFSGKKLLTVPLRYMLIAHTRFIRTYAYDYTHICVCLYAHTRIDIRTYAYSYTHIRVYLYAYKRIYMGAWYVFVIQD